MKQRFDDLMTEQEGKVHFSCLSHLPLHSKDSVSPFDVRVKPKLEIIPTQTQELDNDQNLKEC